MTGRRYGRLFARARHTSPGKTEPRCRPTCRASPPFAAFTEIDVRQTLKDKLDIDVDAQIILGACNPQLAHRALEIDPRVTTLLPCNVVIRTENGRTVVEALDPSIIADVPDNPALRPIAEEAGQRIQAALDAGRERHLTEAAASCRRTHRSTRA